MGWLWELHKIAGDNSRDGEGIHQDCDVWPKKLLVRATFCFLNLSSRATKEIDDD
jgi:hypothetical protein